MTVTAYPTLVFDVLNGSNPPSASGAGPATALTGTSASTDSAGTVVTLDGSPDLSGVATDGSHVIYLEDTTTSARRYAAINATDNTAKTVTVEQAFGASLSGLSWAIGGEMASIEHATARRLWMDYDASDIDAFGDAPAEWQFELQATGTYQLENILYVNTPSSGGYRFFGTGGRAHITVSRQRIVTAGGHANGYTTAIVHHTGGVWDAIRPITWDNIHFESNGTSPLFKLMGGYLGNSGRLTVKNCRFTGVSSTARPNATYDEGAIDLDLYNGTKRAAFIDNCHFKNFKHGISMTNGSAAYSGFALTNSVFEGVRYVFDNAELRPWGYVVIGNVFSNCGGDTSEGHYSRCTLNLSTNSVYGQRGWIVENNTFYESVADDIHINDDSAVNLIRNNISYRAGGHFLSCDTSIGPNLGGMVDYNVVYLPSSSKFNNINNARSLWGQNDSTSDPDFTDAASGDFSVSSTSPAKAAGYPDAVLGAGQSSTRSYVDIGAAQRQEPSGGGGTDAVLVPQGLHSIEAGITA